VIYGWIGGRGYKSYKDNKFYKFIFLWFLIPVFCSWVVSFFIPNYQPFRLLLVLPAFWLLLAFGVFSFSDMRVRNIIAGGIILINLISLGVYYFNPYFWREDWRGVVNYLKREQIPLVISSDTFAWPLVYYQQEKNLIAVGKGVRKVGEEDRAGLTASLNRIKGKKLAYTSYLADLYDPERKIPSWLKEMGFDKMKEISFNQIAIWEYRLIMKYRSFEELPVWKDAVKIGKEIYFLTNRNKFGKDYTLKDQIRRAVVSISSNIAEGLERSNNNEFMRFLSIAKDSVGEARSQLYFAFILGYIDKGVFDNFNSKLEILAKQIGSFISYLKNQKSEGSFLNK